MTKKWRMIFLRQELFSRSVFTCIAIAAAILGVVLLADGYSGTYLGQTAQITSYAFVSDFLLTFLAVSSLGKEFQNRTINMIRVSKLPALEVLVRKWICFILVGAVMASVLVVELAFYRYVVRHVVFDFPQTALSVYMDFVVYASFVFVTSTVVVLWVKNTLTSFLVVYFGTTALLYLTLYLASINDFMAKIMTYVPFNFMRGVFTSGSHFFDGKQIAVMLVWSLVLLLTALPIYKKRAFVRGSSVLAKARIFLFEIF